jgi:hypothetical protein
LAYRFRQGAGPGASGDGRHVWNLDTFVECQNRPRILAVVGLPTTAVGPWPATRAMLAPAYLHAAACAGRAGRRAGLWRHRGARAPGRRHHPQRAPGRGVRGAPANGPLLPGGCGCVAVPAAHGPLRALAAAGAPPARPSSKHSACNSGHTPAGICCAPAPAPPHATPAAASAPPKPVLCCCAHAVAHPCPCPCPCRLSGARTTPESWW